MRAVFALMRIVSRLIVLGVVLLDIAMLWTSIILFSGKPPDGTLSTWLYEFGKPLVTAFSGLAEPTQLRNGGTFSWAWLVGIVVVTVVGLVLARLLAWIRELLYGEFMKTQGVTPGELIDHSPTRVRPPRPQQNLESPELTPDAQFGADDRPPAPPTLGG